MALFLVIAITAWGAEPSMDAPAIMKKVAANTDASAEARRQYIYRQRVRSSLAKGGGEVLCRETREYDVVPQQKTSEKKLVFFSGACLDGKKMAPYTLPERDRAGLRQEGTGDDHGANAGERESIASVVNDLANDSKSRDGIPRQLFPLSSTELQNYRFSLKGETTIIGRKAYKVGFEPLERSGVCVDTGNVHMQLESGRESPQPHICRPWKGDVWVDAEDYQPIRIDTQLAKGVPWAIRVFMGINISQLGFSLTYLRVAPGVWFPSTYGTEFGVKVFWIKRTITLSMENRDFRRTDAQSSVTFDQTQ